MFEVVTDGAEMSFIRGYIINNATTHVIYTTPDATRFEFEHGQGASLGRS